MEPPEHPEIGPIQSILAWTGSHGRRRVISKLPFANTYSFLKNYRRATNVVSLPFPLPSGFLIAMGARVAPDTVEHCREALAHTPLSLRDAGAVILATATAAVDHEAVRAIAATRAGMGGFLALRRHAGVEALSWWCKRGSWAP